jgi:hypothetical protein
MMNTVNIKVGLTLQVEYSTSMEDMKAGLTPIVESMMNMAGTKEWPSD